MEEGGTSLVNELISSRHGYSKERFYSFFGAVEEEDREGFK